MSIYVPVKTALQSSITSVLSEIGYENTQVIHSHQNGLEPTNTYCIVNILGYEQKGGRDEASFIEPSTDILESVVHYGVRTQLSFVGLDSEQVGADFRHSLINNRRCFEIFQRANLGILLRGDLRRIPQKRETQWVAAVNMDVDFSFAVFTRQSYDWIEYITIDGEVIRIWNDE